jgi:type IV pilus assembly protein PilX
MQTFTRTVLNERGSTLVVGVLTLVILSLLGVAATTTSRIEVEIAGNDRAVKQAFYAAEFGLTSGEAVVESASNRLDLKDGVIKGHYGQTNHPDWHVWNEENSVKLSTIPDGLGKMAALPRYTVAQVRYRRDSLTIGIGVTSGIYRFNVTGHGTGNNDTSAAVVRSVYVKRFN